MIYECAASLTANSARNGYRVAQGYTRKLSMRHPVSDHYRLYWKKLEIRNPFITYFPPIFVIININHSSSNLRIFFKLLHFFFFIEIFTSENFKYQIYLDLLTYIIQRSEYSNFSN